MASYPSRTISLGSRASKLTRSRERYGVAAATNWFKHWPARPSVRSRATEVGHASIRQYTQSICAVRVMHACRMDDHAPLSRIQQVITCVLSESPFPGQSELFAQVPFLQIDGGSITFLRLAVDRSMAPGSDFDHGPAPGFAGVFGEDGSPVGTIVICTVVPDGLALTGRRQRRSQGWHRHRGHTRGGG